uniref:Ran-interacting mog1 domain containing protein n=1 Tax=Babesia bovis TaxID=5865 RepID=S6BHN1_BABBO|nr:ran-interacting mog1 domain containing protein [Babesia bovis]
MMYMIFISIPSRIILKDLARCNESVHHKLLTYAPLALKDADSTHPLKGTLVTGIMDVIKGNVHYNGIVISTSIYIYILRLPEHRADILVIYQFPVDITTDTERELKAFQDILKTLRIVDRSLFAHRIPT